MFRRLLFVLCATLAGCATVPPPPPDSGGADPGRLGTQPPPDTCGASRYAHLMGQPKSEAPPPDSMPNYRLAAVGDPLTMDLNPQRLNIFYDPATGRIVGIRCF